MNTVKSMLVKLLMFLFFIGDIFVLCFIIIAIFLALFGNNY